LSLIKINSFDWLFHLRKKQITGGKEEYDKLSSSDYESEAESEGDDISVIEGEG